DADESGDASTSGYTISKDITIQGQGADITTVQSASSENTADRRVFTVPVSSTVTFSELTMRYGKVGSNQNGGGIYVNGNATIDTCDISYNRASDGSGGGVDVRGVALVENSAIHHNVAHYMGGGLNRNYYSGSGGTPGSSDLLDIVNCTISNNQVTQSVAYLEGGGVFYRRGQGSITNSTIAYNQIVNGGGSSTHGVGTGDTGAIVRLKNNIIASNIIGSNLWGGEIGHRESGGGTYVDNGGNIIGKMGYYSTGLSLVSTSWMDQASGYAAPDGTFVLQDGGSTSGQLYLNSSLALNSFTDGTKTLAITDASSMAIDNGTSGSNGSVSVPSTDQRGISRVSGTDIGSYEYGGSYDTTNPSISEFSPSDGATEVSRTSNLTITFTEAVDVESGNIVIKKVSDNSTVETIDVTSGQVSGTGTSSITINPNSTFGFGVEYYVQIDATAFDDDAENSYAGIDDATTWNFTAIDDTTAPTVLSISSNKTNGTYGAGEIIDIDVTFSENVTSTGNIIVTLETGDTDQACNFSVSDASSGTCNYTVQSGDISSDLNASVSGTIVDEASNPMTSFTSSTLLSENKNIVIDTASPVNSNIASSVSSNSVVITWNTNENASSQVEYGLTSSFGSETVETDTSPRVSDHSVSLSSLQSCAKYYFRVKSKDSIDNQIISNTSFFYTGGCLVSSV
ncbi:Ig-like domain-containing protein, partial [Patescibacteria group bacterium]